MGVQVSRLRLHRQADASLSHGAFLIEDALRTQISDDDRLVLVRRLALGAAGPGTGDPRHQAAARVGAAWRALQDRACHGAVDGAAAADLVWFASVHEARRVLMLMLIRGRVPHGWYWRMAVPEWRDIQAPAPLLAHWLAGAADDDEAMAAMPALLAAALDAGGQDFARALVQALAGSPLCPAAPDRDLAWRDAWPGSGLAPADAAARPDDSTRGTAHAQAMDAGHGAATLWAQFPPRIRALLTALTIGLGNASLPLRLLADALVLRHAPALVLAPMRREALVDALLTRLGEGDADAGPSAPAVRTSASPAADRPAQAGAAAPPALASRHHAAHAIEGNDGTTPIAVARGSGPNGMARPALSATAQAPARDLPVVLGEAPSTAAGLFLIVRLMQMLGWRAWLMMRPALHFGNPGAQFLLHVAAHHRVDPADPACCLWQSAMADGELPLHPGDCALWRAGLDRWLKRHCGSGLHWLVHRRGWISSGDQAVVVRFALEDADIRLRRHAIDSDPGWVDWLGWSVRLRFAGPGG